MTEFHAGQFDIAVIGAGHAGIEAALAAARLGLHTPPSAAPARAIWCGNWTPWAAKWQKPPTSAASSIAS